jgi:tetratricopeptide (TPR) repeat protein
MLGEYGEELAQIHRGQEQYSDAPALVAEEGRALAALGRVDEALEVVDEIRVRWGDRTRRREVAEALRAHGHLEAARDVLETLHSEYQRYTPEEIAQGAGRSNWARTLYLLDRFEEAREIYSELAVEAPGNLNNLGSLGVVQARLGEVEKARRIMDQLESVDQLGVTGRNHQWQARIAARLGELDQAVSHLRRAHSKGRRFGTWLHLDPDLEPLRGFRPFEEFKRPKG